MLVSVEEGKTKQELNKKKKTKLPLMLIKQQIKLATSVPYLQHRFPVS